MTDKLAIRLVLLIAAIQVLLQVNLLRGGVDYVTSSLTVDDTYYYLLSAWNAKQLGFVTFDGLHATNGVQFLWFVIIRVAAALAGSKIALLFAVMALTFVLNGLCYLMIINVGAAVRQLPLSVFLAGFWALQSLPFRIYTMGMENSLHAVVFWGVIWQAVTFFIRVETGRKPNLWGLTVFLILNVWTRLDGALLSTVVYTFCLARLAYSQRDRFKDWLAGYARPILGTVVLAGGALAIQLAAFRLMGGTLLPVSALVKTSGAARGLGRAALEKLVEVLVLGMPSFVQGRLPDLGLIVLGLGGVALVFGLWARRRAQTSELRSLLSLWLCLLVGEALYHGYIAVSGVQYIPYFAWYRSPSFIFWTLTGSLIAFAAYQLLQAFVRRPALVSWAPAGFALTAFLVAVYLFYRSVDFRSQLYVARYDAARWIAANFPPQTIFAAWNAGQLGYFSDRTFINLDGVINSADYYRRVLRGSLPLADYLAENRVSFVVDYATYGNVPGLVAVQSFPVNDGSGRSIDVWQLAPSVSSLP
jgi:hypothetical protein